MSFGLFCQSRELPQVVYNRRAPANEACPKTPHKQAEVRRVLQHQQCSRQAINITLIFASIDSAATIISAPTGTLTAVMRWR